MVATTTLPRKHEAAATALIFRSGGTPIEPFTRDANSASRQKTIDSGSNERAIEEFQATSHPEAMVAQANFLSLQISRRRKLRILRSHILKSASIGFGMSSTAAVCGLLSPWAASMFLTASWLIHLIAYHACDQQHRLSLPVGLRHFC